MIAKGLSSALREMATQLMTTADHLDRLGRMWDADDDAPSTVPVLKKKAKAIRKALAAKRKKSHEPHWTQTPEGKKKIAAMNAKRWAKKEVHEEADSPSTPGEGRS
jgi:hypothetical protein